MRKILIASEWPDSVRAFCDILSGDGYDVCGPANGEAAINILQCNDDIAAVITDTGIQGENGVRLFEYVAENQPDIPVILVNVPGTQDQVSWAMPGSVFCYFERKPDYLCLKGILDRALEQQLMRRELESLKKSIVRKNIRYGIVGNTADMQKIREVIEEVKDSHSNVLLCGEPGSGKELIARVINSLGKKDRPFISLNCAEMPKELVEAELFGWENGAFAEVFSKRLRRLEEVSRGTMFFEEIGDLNLSLQAKILKLIRGNGEVAGSSRNSAVDFRIISSTKRDLKQEVRNGNFREDLLFRINQIEITVPPLRERKEDIPLLVSAFTGEFCEREKKTLRVSEKVMEAFENYDWPGNVRQLRNVVERAIIVAKTDTITLGDIPGELIGCNNVVPTGNSMKTFRELEMEALQYALQTCKGNKSKASKILGISRKAMYKRLKENQT